MLKKRQDLQKWPDRTFLESSERRPSRKTAGVMWASALARASAKEKIYAKNLAGNTISLKITVCLRASLNFRS